LDFSSRFWEKVSITPNCWEWSAGRNHKGYGVFQIGTAKKSNVKLAHRISFALTYGDIPPSILVCHKCDNPACVRPDHLFAGNALVNTQDMIRKGRSKFFGYLPKALAV
jgi:hypothetical protein